MPRSGLVAALWAVAAIVVAGQTTPPQAPVVPQTPQIFRSDVDVIRLDVTVLDKDRRPVPGLTADDFSVFENGKPQRIVAVSQIDAVLNDPEPSPWMRSTPSDVATNDLVDQVGNGRVFVVLMDDVNTPWDDLDIIMSAREIGRLVIDSLAPSDLAAVVFPRDAGKTVDFTSDRRKLLRAIDQFDPREPEYWISDGNTYRGPGQGGGDIPQRFAPSMARSNCQRQQLTVPTLETLVARLATVPNRRKTVVFVSTGVPLTLVERRGCAGELANTMRDVLRDAQRANVNIHGVDPGGYRGFENYLQMPIRRGGRPAEFVYPAEAARNAARLRHDFLEMAADHTGAHAIVNSQDIAGGVAKMFSEDSIYYLVGYQTSNGRPDGKFRRVEVKVNRPGLTARTRSGYYAPVEGSLETPDQKRAPASAELGMTGMMSPAGLPLRGTATAIALAPGGQAEVAIVLSARLPPIRAQLSETLNIVRTIYDAESRPGPPVQDKVILTLEPSAGDELRYDVYQRITLPAGRHQIRLNATSAALDRSGSVYVDVDVPDFARAPLSLSRVVLGRRAPDSGRADPLAPLVPIVPTSARDFSPNDPIVAFVRVFQGGSAALAPVTVTAHLFDVGDTMVFETTIARAIDSFDGTRAAAVEIPLPLDRLSRGPHLLNVTAAITGGPTTRSDIVFRIR